MGRPHSRRVREIAQALVAFAFGHRGLVKMHVISSSTGFRIKLFYGGASERRLRKPYRGGTCLHSEPMVQASLYGSFVMQKIASQIVKSMRILFAGQA